MLQVTTWQILSPLWGMLSDQAQQPGEPPTGEPPGEREEAGKWRAGCPYLLPPEPGRGSLSARCRPWPAPAQKETGCCTATLGPRGFPTHTPRGFLAPRPAAGAQTHQVGEAEPLLLHDARPQDVVHLDRLGLSAGQGPRHGLDAEVALAGGVEARDRVEELLVHRLDPVAVVARGAQLVSGLARKRKRRGSGSTASHDHP